MKPTEKSSKTRMATPAEMREIVSKQPSRTLAAMEKEADERRNRKRPSSSGQSPKES